MMHIFISHQTNEVDNLSASMVCQAIEQLESSIHIQETFGSVDYFIDIENLHKGEVLKTQIEHHLQRAGLLVVVLSPQALCSEWVSYEVLQFSELHPNAPIVPMFSQDCQKSDDKNGILELLMDEKHERLAVVERREGGVYGAASLNQFWQGTWNMLGFNMGMYRAIPGLSIPGSPQGDVPAGVYEFLNTNWKSR